MDEKGANENGVVGWWSGFSATPVSLNPNLRHFVEVRPWRDGSEHWVQPLSGAFSAVLERVHSVRVVANLIYEYLPTYSCWVHCFDPSDTSLIIRSASFYEEDVLYLDVIGEGWESHKWLDKWPESDRKNVYDTDQYTSRNFCGALCWRDRSSATAIDRHPGSHFQIREQLETEDERRRLIKEDKSMPLKNVKWTPMKRRFRIINWRMRIARTR